MQHNAGEIINICNELIGILKERSKSEGRIYMLSFYYPYPAIIPYFNIKHFHNSFINFVFFEYSKFWSAFFQYPFDILIP